MRRGSRGTLVAVVAVLVVASVVGGAFLLGGRSSTGTSEEASSSEPASLAASASAASAAFGAVGTTENVPCPEYLTQGAAFTAAGDEVEGETFSCGVVVVPENHDAPDGRTIEVFYLKLHARSQTADAAPMVYLAGGPGSSGSYELTANPLLNQNLDRVRQTRDIIAYDQRGTGFSNYLLCAPFESTIGILEDRDRNPAIAQTITDLQTKEQGIGYGALRANLCGVGTQALAGVDLSQYNSTSSARDIPMLVDALGYTQGYSLYGTSYGTKLAQEAMRTVPDGITGVILDGPSGPSIPNNMWSSTKNVSPYVELIAQCQEDSTCTAAYPNLGDRFDALLTRLEKKPLVLDPPLTVWSPLTLAFPTQLTQIDPQFFLDAAKLNNLAVGGGFAAQIPQMIQAAEAGDVDFFRSSKLNAANSGEVPPPTTVPEQSSTQAAFQSDQPLFQQPFTTLIQAAQGAAANATQAGPDGRWLTIALGDLAGRLEGGENQADLMEALLRLSVLPNVGVSSQQLLDYAKDNLSPDAAKAADEIVAKMSRNDVRATMWNIQDVAMVLGKQPDVRNDSSGMQYAFNCADELAFSSLEQAKADVASTPYPQLVAFPIKLNEQILASCVAYPSPLDRSVTEPVVSDIPTLIYAGALDNETPAPWARTVAKGLSRSTLVEWNNMGHIAAAHDPKLCAGDVAAAFLADPSVTPDLTCSASKDYSIAFALG